MKTTMRAIITLCAILGHTLPAAALSVTNTDETSHTVVLTVGNQSSEHEVSKGSTLELDCLDGCLLSLASTNADHEAFQADDADKLTITEGAFVRSDADVKDAESEDIK